MTYSRSRCITELRGLATAAAQLEIRRAQLYRNAEPSVRLRLQDVAGLDIELTDIWIAARKIADRLEREAAEPVLHLDGAS